MNQQPRLRETEATRRTGQLLSEAIEGLDRPWSATSQEAVQRQIQARVLGNRSRPIAFWGALAMSSALGAVAIVVGLQRLNPLGERVITLGSEAKLVLSRGAEVDLPPLTTPQAGRRVVLHTGKVCAEVAHRDLARQGTLLVEAPNLNVVVIGTQFCVSTLEGISTVAVTQGRVRAETTKGGTSEVGAGETLRSDDPRLALAAPSLVLAPAAQMQASPECPEAHSISERRACYARIAQGQGLAAQNALYGLGLLERDEAHDGPAALADWRAYQQRFAQGVFAPEVSLGALGELLSEKRFTDALTEADRYLASSDEGLRDPVQLLRAQLLAASLGQPSQALPLLQTLADNAKPDVRAEALFSLGQCLGVLGRRADAGEVFRRYLSEFPQGQHAAEARAWTP